MKPRNRRRRGSTSSSARLSGWLGHSSARDSDPSELSLRQSCERMQAVVLERASNGACPLERGIDSRSPLGPAVPPDETAAQALTLDLAVGRGRPSSQLAQARAEWIDALEHRRNELADAADDRLFALTLAARARPCERIVQSALDEAGETMAFLEDMHLRRAVDRLNLIGGDLGRLARSCLRWPVEQPQGRSPLEIPGAIFPRPCDPATGAAVDHSPAGDRDQPDVAESDALEANGHDEPSDVAVKRLRKQARLVDRASRQARREWQEKLLALRMETLFGRRFVATLENTVLALILVLFGLMAAEAVLEHARPEGLSRGQHWFFAWADLAVCSVFLFEFTLKLALAPHRLSYFLRHLVIDLLASLPYGFVAHQIELDRMDDLLGTGGGSGSGWRPARIARVARAFRFLRVGLPIVRLTRVGLILLRLSDRLVRRMGKLLNRNIVLFEPLVAQKPESSDRHRLIALRSELDHARTSIQARLDREQSRRLCERVLGDLECRVESLPDPGAENASVEATGREIPVEAVVERLIQMTPERLLDQMGPASVKALDRYLRLLDLPLVRRLPLVRNLVAYREKSPAEAVALAANYVGQLIQRGLDVVYFFADLHGTLSPPVFLDRLGATIVNATTTKPLPKRLDSGWRALPSSSFSCSSRPSAPS